MVRTWAEKEMRNLIRLVLWLLFLSWPFYDCLSIMRIHLSQDYRPHRFQVQSPSCCGVMFSSWALLVEMTCTWAFTFTIYRCTNTSQQLIQTWQYFRVFDKYLNDTPGFLSDLIGVFLRPAPLLKNAVLSESKARELYLQIIQNMRIMYNEARLVHADLSEFNML